MHHLEQRCVAHKLYVDDEIYAVTDKRLYMRAVGSNRILQYDERAIGKLLENDQQQALGCVSLTVVLLFSFPVTIDRFEVQRQHALLVKTYYHSHQRLMVVISLTVTILLAPYCGQFLRWYNTSMSHRSIASTGCRTRRSLRGPCHVVRKNGSYGKPCEFHWA